MPPASIPPNETERLTALHKMRLLDTPPEREFDELVELARHLAATPTGVMSLIDADRQWFKARRGLNACETPRDAAFCAHAILQDAPLWVEDARADARFAENPLVVGDPAIRFYLGAPITVAGCRIGTICAFGPSPRPYEASVAEAFTKLARLAALQITARADRRLAEIAVKVAATTSDALICMDEEGLVTLWNRAAADVFGWSAEEMMGASVERLMPRSSGPRVKRLFDIAQEASGTDTTREEAVLVDRWGGEVAVEISLSRYQIENAWNIAAVVRDRRHAQQVAADAARDRAGAETARRAATASQSVLELFVQQAPAPLLMTDSDLVVLRVSQSWREFYGLADEDVVGRSIFTVFPESEAAWGAVYRRGLDGAAEAGLTQSSHAVRNGAPCWMRWSVSPWRGTEGEIAGLVLANLDVTDLVQARESAERSEQAQSAFLANISHEIRTPLNGILGLASGLRREPLAPAQAAVLSTIESSAQTLTTLLGDIPNFSRLQVGDLVLQPQPFDIAALTDELTRTFEPLARAKGLDFRVEIAPGRSQLH